MITAGEIRVERSGSDQASFEAVFGLLLELHRAVGIAPLNPDKTAKTCYHVLCEGMTFVAWSEHGEPVGTLGLVEAELYYADVTYLQDKWFYVKSEWRGRAGVKLLLAAREECERLGKVGIIDDTNQCG